jgi:hypothetical protein
MKKITTDFIVFITAFLLTVIALEMHHRLTQPAIDSAPTLESNRGSGRLEDPS